MTPLTRPPDHARLPPSPARPPRPAPQRGNTPLIIAAYCALADVMVRLLAVGADPSVCNHFGETAWEGAAWADEEGLVPSKSTRLAMRAAHWLRSFVARRPAAVVIYCRGRGPRACHPLPLSHLPACCTVARRCRRCCSEGGAGDAAANRRRSATAGRARAVQRR